MIRARLSMSAVTRVVHRRVVQASPTRKNDRAIVARSVYAVWPVAESLQQKLCNLLGEFCIDILMKNKSCTYLGYYAK